MNRYVEIGGRCLGAGNPALIVAEIGINHNGDLEMAKRLIAAAKACGADAVKFQSFHTDEFMSDRAQEYEYESAGKVVRESMYAMFKRYEFPYEAMRALVGYARSLGLIAFATPTDVQAMETLVGLGVPAIKVGSDDLVNLSLLRAFAAKGLPMIISTGMARIGEVEDAVEAIHGAGNENLVILHCISLYPTPPEEVHLRRIATLQQAFAVPIGFSDHSWGVTAAIGAIALGAVVIEKHFTLDRNLPGPDHRFSADPAELRALVEGVRAIERNLGSSVFRLSEAEAFMRRECHRSVVAAQPIAAGTVLAREHLTLKRPGSGLPPKTLETLIGRTVKTDIAADQLLAWEMI